MNQAATATPEKTSTTPAPSPTKRTQAPLQPGYYTVVMGVEHVTFRIATQPKDASFMPGKNLLARLVGPDNTSSYRSVALVSDDKRRAFVWHKHRDDSKLMNAIAVLEQQPEAAAKGYAKRSGRCYVCGRLLTEPGSIESGIGPVCAERGF